MSTSSTAAELSSAADAIDGYRRRVAALARQHAGEDRDDLVTAIDEAERSLHIAERALQRALKLAGR